MPNLSNLSPSHRRIGAVRRGVCSLATALALAGCYAGAAATGESEGSAGSGGPGGPDGSDGSDGSESGADDGTGDTGGAIAGCLAPVRRLALLSNRRYANAVRDLLGLAAAPVVSNGGGTGDSLLATGSDQVNAALVFEYHSIAETAADQALTQLEMLAPCPPGDDELGCASAMIDELGARAFRRPLTEVERSGLLDVYQTGYEQDGNYPAGVRLVITALLQSPTFLYLSELGEPIGDGQFALTPWEVAAQLSFLLADTLPDAALTQAAADGRLGSEEGVVAEVERMLATPAARANISSLYLRWIGSNKVAEVEKSSDDFTPELQASLQKETELFIDDLLWQRGAKLRDMLTSRTSWVNATLAAYYGVEAPAGEEFAPVELPPEQRSGVLTHGSLLASLSGVSQTSVVYRGLFVARDLLCVEFPPPPPGATETGPDESKGERARSEWRMENNPCSACHSTFDPFGLMFEHYDELGRYRTTIGDVPVDASFDIKFPASAAGPAEDIVEFAARLAETDEVARCAAQRVTTYALARPYDKYAACYSKELGEALIAADGDLVELVRLVANSPMLRFRSQEED